VIPHLSERAMILAPNGRDAAVAAAMLAEAGVRTEICAGLADLVAHLASGAGLAVVTEEAVNSADLRPLAAWLEQQPEWSDFPFILLTRRGGGLERNPGATRLLKTLGNVTFIERPFHPTTLVSLAEAALRGRRRQYEARARLQNLHESEERLAMAMQSASLGAWSIDLETQTLATSEVARRIYGRTPEEGLAYEELLAAVHPADVERVQEGVRRSIKSGEDYDLEYRIQWPDGRLRWIKVNGRAMRNGGERTRMLVGVVLDITERKEAEDMLRDANALLERRVAERTAELRRSHDQVLEEIKQREGVEDQLRQAQKMEAIGQLTGGVAHDFNNLLMAVLSNLELLRRHVPDDGRALRLIDGALQGARRGAALTQRLLAFARRQDLRTGPADMAELIDGIGPLLERSLGPDVELRFRMARNLPQALVDANQIELALLNLVVNARDAMPEGGQVTIETDCVDADGGGDLQPGKYVRVTVTDTGAGMDAETLERAIEPFFSTKELGKGTGLGLSMIHGLAVQLNGALRLSSTPGEGTRAELYFPVAPAEVAPAPQEAAAAQPSHPVARAKILLVDDDALIAMSTADMLEDLGHEVIEANSAASALETLKTCGGVDLLITDFAMPGMNGAQLAEAARALAPGLPILLATGYAEMPNGEGTELPRLGKPYSQAQLAREIGKLLAGAG